jgi:HEAT repeat protein
MVRLQDIANRGFPLQLVSLMTKKLIIAVVVLGIVAAAAWFEPTRTVRGWALGDPFFDGRSASGWEARLQSSDPTDQATTPEKLEAGKAAAMPVLIKILASPDPGVRWKVANILARIGPDARDAVMPLIDRLDDPDPFVRKVAAEALGEIRETRPEVISAIKSKLNTSERDSVIRALSKFGAAAAPAVPELIAIVKNSELGPTTHWEAIRTLGKIGPPAHEATPTLVGALKDHEEDVREHAAESLGEIGATSAVPDLIAALQDESPRVRRDAVRSLGQLGAAAKPAIGAIEKLLKDKAEPVQEAAKTALRRIDPEGHGKQN